MKAIYRCQNRFFNRSAMKRQQKIIAVLNFPHHRLRRGVSFYLQSFFGLFFLLIPLSIIGCEQQVDSCTLLITGCGRSGTNYTAVLLEKSGYAIYHERFGEDGCVSWPMAVNSYSPWGPISEDSFQHVFHQVRHPLAVITSWVVNLYDLDRDEWVFIRKHIPEIDLEDPLIVQSAKYWYYWNLVAEQQAEWRYCIENLFEVLPEFIDRSGLVLDSKMQGEVPLDFNAWLDTSNKITWLELKNQLPEDLYYKIEEMAIRYGYVPI